MERCDVRTRNVPQALAAALVGALAVLGGSSFGGSSVAGAAPEPVDTQMLELVAVAPGTPVSAVISFTEPLPVGLAVDVAQAVRVRAFFHAFHGVTADYSGGYVLPADATSDQLTLIAQQYVEAQRTLLETNVLTRSKAFKGTT